MSEAQVWKKKSTFIFAAAGSAIGLGNLWKFPYTVGENGGGAFVIIYLLCVLLIGLPVMMSESLIGKYAHGNAIDAISATAKQSNANKNWKGIAALGLFTALLMLSFYSVIAGWALDYTWAFSTGEFINKDAAAVSNYFGQLQADPIRLIIWHTVFMLLTATIIARGAQEGIEKSLGLMMPLLFIILFLIVAYSAIATGKFGETMTYMFTVDFNKITPMVVVNALGQAFFSLSLGMCCIMTYAAYMRDDISIARSAIYVSGLDTLMALLAGFAIFPIVFANGLDAGGGPGLLFVTLSTAFAKIGVFGTALGVLFFFLVIIAALSSSISLVEPFVKWLEERFKLNRVVITFGYCFVVWAIGLLSVFSFNIWSEIDILGTGKTPFGLITFFSTSVLLPLGGLLLSIYVGWVMDKKICREQLSTLSGTLFSIWLFIMRFVAPISISIIFIASLMGKI